MRLTVSHLNRLPPVQVGRHRSGQELQNLPVRRQPGQPSRPAAGGWPGSTGKAHPPGVVPVSDGRETTGDYEKLTPDHRSLIVDSVTFHTTMKRPYLINLLLLAAALLLSVAVGAVDIPLGALVRILGSRLGLPVSADWPVAFPVILFSLRLPHTALIVLAGAALAGSGAAYQGLFRNPLADPYLIGVASGAGLGAVAAMALPARKACWGCTRFRLRHSSGL